MKAQKQEHPADAYLKQSALALARICRKHFGISGKADDLKVEGRPQARNVSEFLAEYTARVRPMGLSESRVLPDADDTRLRILLWTPPIANAVLNDVVRLSLYSDQTIVIDPFSAHVSPRPFQPAPEGPFEQPDQWVQLFVNYGLMIVALEPWIQNSLVTLLPAPRMFLSDRPPFDQIAMAAVERGLISTEVTPEALADMLEGAAWTAWNDYEVQRLVELILGDDYPTTAQADVVKALLDYRKATPMRYTPPTPFESRLLVTGTGQNVMEATWIADRLGGYLVPRSAHDRRTFRNVSRGSSKDTLDGLAAAFAAADLPMLNNVKMSDALDLRRDGRLAGFRTYLHDVWKASSSSEIGTKALEHERALQDRLVDEHRAAKEDWRRIYQDLGVKGSLALFGTHALPPIIEGQIIPLVAGAASWLYKGWTDSSRSFRRKPSALLVELENASNPNPIRRVAAALERRA